MRLQKSFPITIIGLVLGVIATVSLAQEAQDDLSAGEVGAGANLVITSVAGPATATHNETISLTYTVKNQGTVASGSYKVGLYLSTDNKIHPAADLLLDKETFPTGLLPGENRKATAKVLVPINGLSGNYYFGAVVAGSKKTSSKQVSFVRYSLADDNDTVKDHKTGLIWQRVDDGLQRNWADATQYCGDLVLGGKADWRLPRTDELETIIDYSRSDPSIDPVFDCRAEGYWSGNTSVSNPGDAWLVGFYYGNALGDLKSNTYYVRCMRGVPGGVPISTFDDNSTATQRTPGRATMLPSTNMIGDSLYPDIYFGPGAKGTIELRSSSTTMPSILGHGSNRLRIGSDTFLQFEVGPHSGYEFETDNIFNQLTGYFWGSPAGKPIVITTTEFGDVFPFGVTGNRSVNLQNWMTFSGHILAEVTNTGAITVPSIKLGSVTPTASKPGAITITQAGTPGSTTYVYRIVARAADGTTSLASDNSTTTTGPATLGVTDYNVLDWADVPGAATYDVYRLRGGPCQGRIWTLRVASTVWDNGPNTCDNEETYPIPPTAAVSGGIISPQVDSTTAIQIMKADGTTPQLTVDTTTGRTTIAGPFSAGSGGFIVGADGDVAAKSMAAMQVYVSHSATENANAADMYGQIHLITGGYTVTLPAVFVGMHARFRVTTATVACIQTQPTDHHVLAGRALSEGYKICSDGYAGSEIELDAPAANTWWDSNANGLWVDSGA